MSDTYGATCVSFRLDKIRNRLSSCPVQFDFEILVLQAFVHGWVSCDWSFQCRIPYLPFSTWTSFVQGIRTSQSMSHSLVRAIDDTTTCIPSDFIFNIDDSMKGLIIPTSVAFSYLPAEDNWTEASASPSRSSHDLPNIIFESHSKTLLRFSTTSRYISAWPPGPVGPTVPIMIWSLPAIMPSYALSVNSSRGIPKLRPRSPM